ncbi:MAG TPA: enolase C-terminal domain-like protein [Beijerinckiaceae bacterium]|nr:enolase C-terminal domain-like protein [Beijerinckiaceae bacterium]
MEGARIARVAARAYTVPTDAPEGDGTFTWESTTMVLVEIEAGGATGLGYTYSTAAAARVVEDVLAPVVTGEDAFAIPRLWAAMVRAVRNLGLPGIAATAISAVDSALWDLEARLLDLPLARLFGMQRDAVAIYGSGGFTTYSDHRLRDQFAGWVAQEGCRLVKMKIGAQPGRDVARMRAAREAIGDAALMIDANGAFDRKEALLFAGHATEFGVIWFEEPVSSDDLDGLRLLRDRAPAPASIMRLK